MTIFVPEFNFSSGTETVLLKVLPRLVSAGHTVVLAAPANRLLRYKERGLDQRIRRVELAWEQRSWRLILRAITRRIQPGRISMYLWRACLRDLVRRENATHVFVPWIVNYPAINFGRPTGVMIMDLAWRHYPATWFEKSPAQLDALLKLWLEQAQIIFPVSDSTNDELRQAFPETASKLVSVPHGSEWKGDDRNPPDHIPPGQIPFFLTPAALTPNKNHALLLTAAIQLWSEGYEFRLIWTGSNTARILTFHDSDRQEIRELQNKVRQHAGVIRGRLDVRGFVSDSVLATLYKNCQCVVLPSSYEGFGLPLLEAYEHGAKVICANIPPFLEQTKRYAMQDRTKLIPAGDLKALTSGLRGELQDLNHHSVAPVTADLRQRIQNWTWDDAVRRYAEALDSL